MKTRQRFYACFAIFVFTVLLAACSSGPADYDVIIRGGSVYDGLGGEPIVADVAITADRVVEIGDLAEFKGAEEIDASGMAVAPGFINMLSWATESLIEDGQAVPEDV